MARSIFYSFFKFTNESKEPDCPKWNSEFVQEIIMFEKKKNKGLVVCMNRSDFLVISMSGCLKYN